MRPSALGLYFLVGLGNQLLLLFCPCLPAVLLRLIPLCVFCCGNLLSLSLVTLLGVFYLFQGFLQVDEVQGPMVTAEWPLGVLTYTSESTVSCGIQTVMRTSPLHVLLKVADTSGPWMAGGVVRLLLFLYTFMFRVVLSHFMCRVSHKVCFSNWSFWALSCLLRAKVWSRPLSSLRFIGT